MKQFINIMLCILAVGILTNCSHPTPDIKKNRITNLQADAQDLQITTQPTPLNLGLQDLLKIALTNNLDLLLANQEYSIQQEITKGTKLSQLPSLTINGERSIRDTSQISASSPATRDGEIGPRNTTFSTTEDRRRETWSLGAAWNLLDFGLTYLKTRQAQNQALISQQKQLRTRQKLVLDVWSAYWKAVVYQYALTQAEDTLLRGRRIEKALDHQIKYKTISEIVGLKTKDQIMQMQMRASQFQNELDRNLNTLSHLLSLPPGTKINLEELKKTSLDIPIFDLNLSQLGDQALLNRPELYQSDLQSNIDQDEYKQSFLKLFPNVTLFANLNYDNNKHHLYDNWIQVGTRTAWNLLSLPGQMSSRKTNKLKLEYDKQNRLALSLGILSQLYLAYIEYREALTNLKISKDLLDVKKNLLNATKQAQLYGESDQVEVIKLEAEALFTSVTTLNYYADVQISLEKIANTVGIPLLFTPIDVVHLAQQLSPQMQHPALLTNIWLDCGNTSIKETEASMSQRYEMALKLEKELRKKTLSPLQSSLTLGQLPLAALNIDSMEFVYESELQREEQQIVDIERNSNYDSYQADNNASSYS